MRSCALMMVFALGSGCVMAQSGANWDYAGKTGPLAWGRLDPAYQACSKGHEQAPIDIHGAHLNKKLQPIEFHYLAASVELENTGNLIVAHVKPGSYIVAEGVRYDLQQFEFDRRQIYWLSAMQYSPRCGIQFHVTYANDFRDLLFLALSGP